MQLVSRLTAAVLLSALVAVQASAMPPVTNKAEADAYFEANKAPAPDGYELHFKDCATDNCSLDRAMLAEALQLAHQKDYQAQRNLAYCLEYGCDVIEPDPVEGCAWRMVLLASDSPELNKSDARNLDACVQRLGPAGVQSAKVRATALVLRIYGEDHLKDPL